MHTRCPPRWPTVSRIIAAGETKKKKSQALPAQWSLDLGFVVFSTSFPVSCVSCLEAAKPSGRPVEPSVGAVNSLQLLMIFPQWKRLEKFLSRHCRCQPQIPELSIQAEDLKLNVHVYSIISCNRILHSRRKACNRNKDLARSWREWWRESLRVKVWQGSTDLQRGSILYTIQVLGHKPR